MTFPASRRDDATAMTNSNPANAPATKAARVPMSLPTLKLAIPEIPGYVCHWFRGTQQRIQQAQRAGYQFVNSDEVQVAEIGLANDASGNGNTDLGTRVSISAGDEAMEGGSGLRLYLMKLPKELWDQDQLAVEEKHEEIAATLRGDAGLRSAGDNSNRYSRGEQKTHMFQPRRST